jgi:hypothetical protein
MPNTRRFLSSPNSRSPSRVWRSDAIPQVVLDVAIIIIIIKSASCPFWDFALLVYYFLICDMPVRRAVGSYTDHFKLRPAGSFIVEGNGSPNLGLAPGNGCNFRFASVYVAKNLLSGNARFRQATCPRPGAWRHLFQQPIFRCTGSDVAWLVCCRIPRQLNWWRSSDIFSRTIMISSG